MPSRLPALLAAAALLAATPAGGAEELVDGIAAQVGSDIVLVSEVREIAAPVEAQLNAAGAPPAQIAKLRADILESLVERALVRQLVRRNELEASDDEVDTAIAAIAGENGITTQQLRASVEAQGLSFEAYRERIRGEIEHNKVMNGMVASQVRIDEDQLREAFDEQFADQPAGGVEVHLRHLLVPFTSDDKAEQRAACLQVEQALARIRGGEPFSEVARETSVVNPQQGGDIGWLHADNVAAWMQPAVGSLEPGQTSDVLETGFGCNLLQLVERRGYEPVEFDQVRDRLRQQLFQEQMREEYGEFIDKLREQTYVERKGYFADAASLGDEDPFVYDEAASPGGAAP